jgi:hypothetical protein
MRTQLHQQEEYIGRKELACDVSCGLTVPWPDAVAYAVIISYLYCLGARLPTHPPHNLRLASVSRLCGGATEGAGSVELFDTFCTVPVIASSAPIRRAKCMKPALRRIGVSALTRDFSLAMGSGAVDSRSKVLTDPEIIIEERTRR